MKKIITTFLFLITGLLFIFQEATSQEATDKEIELGVGLNVSSNDSLQSTIQFNYRYFKKDWLYFTAKSEFWFIPNGKSTPLLAGAGIYYFCNYTLCAGFYPIFRKNETRLCFGFNPSLGYKFFLDDWFSVTFNLNYHKYWYNHKPAEYLDLGIGLAYLFE